jgi:uncharacterized protein YutD
MNKPTWNDYINGVKETPEDLHKRPLLALRRHIRNLKRRKKAFDKNVDWIDNYIAEKMSKGMDLFDLAKMQSNRNLCRKEISWMYKEIKKINSRIENS